MGQQNQHVLVILSYLLLGVGLLGGWQYWAAPVKVLYVLTFPVHALLASLIRDLWPKDDGDKAVAWAILLFILLVCMGA